MISCILCEATGGMDRVCGFDICPTCHTGSGIESHLERLGLGFESRTWRETRKSNDSTVTVNCIEIILHLPQPIDASAHFGQGPTAEHVHANPIANPTVWQTIRHWMDPQDIQVGDSLFDDAVFISEPLGEALLPLLQDEGVQSAVMELVSKGGVRLDDNWLRIRRSSSQFTPSIQKHSVPLALLALHILTFTAIADALPS